MKRIEFKSSYDEQRIVYDYFEAKKVKKIFVIIHGKHEYSDRYHEIAIYLQKKEHSSYIINLRGHGHTGKLNKSFGYFIGDSKQSHFKDIDTLISIVKKNNEGKKIILLGHSMGSYITRIYLSQFDNVDGYICCGTTNLSFLKLSFAVILARVISVFKGKKNSKLLKKMVEGHSSAKYNGEFEGSWLSSDQKKVESFFNSPLKQYEFKNKTFADFLWFIKKMRSKSVIKKTNRELPILFINGGKDISSNNGALVKKLYLNYKLFNKNVKHIQYDNMRHEIIQVTDSAKVFNDIEKFANNISN